ncbi:MAG TPA: GGDEF domain-containing protein [Solirubrobacteraceae bacterium]
MRPANTICQRDEAVPGAEPDGHAAIAAELDRLEIQTYVRLDGIADAAAALVARARRLGLDFGALRAELLRSDAMSRGGKLHDALELQRSIAQAARDRGEIRIEARAGCLLAATYYRLGLRSESQLAAGDGVELLDEDCPAQWHVEHYMVLALFTSYDRAGAVDFGLFEEALRRAREFGSPTLLLAVLNNYAWTAEQSDGGHRRAAELVAAMEGLIASGRVHASLPIIDTVGWVHLADGNVDYAEELFERALTYADQVEPDDFAAVLAHLAAVRRRQRRGAEAIALLERARAIALAGDTPEVAVDALRELATLDAERGDHRRAYRRLLRYVAEQRQAERVESERRASVLQTIHGTKVERDQRRYFESLATCDALTGLYNRRHVEGQLPGLVGSADVAIAMIDVDHFKRINDLHSHEAGDAVLTLLGEMFSAFARDLSPTGFAARLGGEEFLLVLPAVTWRGAQTALEDLRRRVAAHDWYTTAPDAPPTISAGLVFSTPRQGLTPSEILARADRALYEAKRRGRNRVVAASDVAE